MHVAQFAKLDGRGVAKSRLALACKSVCKSSCGRRDLVGAAASVVDLEESYGNSRREPYPGLVAPIPAVDTDAHKDGDRVDSLNSTRASVKLYAIHIPV